MKKIFAITLVIVIVVITLCSCSGVDTSNIKPKGLAIVMSHTQGFPNAAISSDKAVGMIEDTCKSFGSIKTIELDGNSFVAGDYKISKPSVDVDQAKLDQIVKKSVNAVITECNAVQASEPEIDLLSGIQLAANSLQGIKANEKSLIVYASGLSTKGLLNNLNGDLLNAEPSSVVEQLNSMHAIPVLKNTKVLWLGLGSTAGKQGKIPDSYKSKLQTLWTKILEAGGATVTFDSTPIQGEEGQDLPETSVVEFIEDKLEFTSVDLKKTYKFDENSSVKFIADKSRFIDYSKAKSELKKVANALLNTDERIVIVGTTATYGTEEYTLNLSLARAKACKKVLEEFGVSSNRIRCIGLGTKKFKYRVNDLSADGELIESEAAKNRAIYIFSEDSATAKSLNV